MKGYMRGNIGLGEAAGMALAFVLFVVVVSVGGQVLAGIQTSQLTAAGATIIASNATGQGLTGITNLAGQAGTIGTVIGAAVLIGIVVGAFAMAKRD